MVHSLHLYLVMFSTYPDLADVWLYCLLYCLLSHPGMQQHSPPSHPSSPLLPMHVPPSPDTTRGPTHPPVGVAVLAAAWRQDGRRGAREARTHTATLRVVLRQGGGARGVWRRGGGGWTSRRQTFANEYGLQVLFQTFPSTCLLPPLVICDRCHSSPSPCRASCVMTAALRCPPHCCRCGWPTRY